MNIAFTKATRAKAKARVALCGPSGAGKTHSSLLLAAGLAGPNGKIAVIDTEANSAQMEAGKQGIPDYDVAVMTAPFDPLKYIAAIKAAEQAGYDVIVIDSLTHAWSGSGGLLEKKDAISAQMKGAGWDAWRKITPQHNKLVEAILQSTSHIVATIRSKQEYATDRDEQTGKISIKKLGLAPVQREGIDYEFTVVLDIDQQSHQATASKDRTSLFDGQVGIITTDAGQKLRDWLNSGQAETAPQTLPETPPAAPEPPTATPNTPTPTQTAPNPPQTPTGSTEGPATAPQTITEGSRKLIEQLLDRHGLVKEALTAQLDIDTSDLGKLSAADAQRAVNWLMSQPLPTKPQSNDEAPF